MGVELKELAFRKDRVLGWSKSQRLGHLRDANDFLSRLTWTCRNSSDHVLALVEGEASAARRNHSRSEFARPDGFGVIDGPQGRCRFYLELDRGSEPIERVSEKLRFYDMAGYKKDPPWVLLFCVHSERREVNLQKALYQMEGLAIATSTLDRHLRDPLGANWLPVGEHVRYPLPEVPSRGIPHPQAHEDDHRLGGIIRE